MASKNRTLQYTIAGDEKDLNRALDKADQRLDATGKTADKAFDRAQKSAKDAGDAIDKSMGGAASKSAKHASKMGDDIVSGFTTAKNKVKAQAADFGSGIADTVGANMGVALAGAGGLAAGVLVKGFMDGLDRENVGAKTAAQLGLTGDYGKVAGETAGRLYAQGFGESVGDAGLAVTKVTQNIGGLGSMSKEQFDEITKYALNTATVFNEDLGKSTAAVGQLIRTGLVKDAQEGFDLITRGLQMPANKSEDLLDTFNEYSTMFRSLGLTGPQSLGLLNQAVLAGARDSDIAADALKEFTIRIKDGSTLTAESVRKLGITAEEASRYGITGMQGWSVTAEDLARTIAKGGPEAAGAVQLITDRIRGLKDPTDQAAIATGLFGTQSEDMQKALLAFDPSTAVQNIGKVEGAAKSASDAMGDTSQARFEQWKRSMESNVTDFIDQQVIPAFGRLADKYHELFGEDSGQSLRQGAQVLAGGDGGNWWSNDVAPAIVSSLTGTPLTNWAKGLLGFDDGGMVPGPVGSPQIIKAHGGETILPTHKAAAGAMVGDTYVIHGSVYGVDDLLGVMAEAKRRGARGPWN